MATNTKTTDYQLHLKGFVGGYDFDADYVDYILNKNKGSVGFFEWGQLNSDGLQALIDNIEHQKADLFVVLKWGEAVSKIYEAVSKIHFQDIPNRSKRFQAVPKFSI